MDLTEADLFDARCGHASFKKACLRKTVFCQADLQKAVMTEADCTGADFRRANLGGAKFAGAKLGAANFEGSQGIPTEVAKLLDAEQKAPDGAVVPDAVPA